MKTTGSEVLLYRLFQIVARSGGNPASGGEWEILLGDFFYWVVGT